MRSQSKVILFVAPAVVATAATPLAAGALTATQQDVTQSTQTQVDESDNETEAEGDETDEAETDSEIQSFEIVSVSAPNSTAPNSTVTVIAYVENTNSMAAAQEVEFRVDGNVVDRERIDVDGESIAIHDSSLLDGVVAGSVIGVSEYLEPGTHDEVSVPLFDVPGATFNETSLTDGETLIAMPHLDTDDNETEQ